MKKVLITGASGTLGWLVVKYLIADEDNYEITALDLKNHRSRKRLKKYRKRLNLVYGDVNDSTLMESLVKDHDYIIHLAGIIPPFADLKPELTKIIEYEGTKTIIDAINKVNPDCFLVFASTTSVYGKTGLKRKTTDDLVIDEEDAYSLIKAETETLIKENLKKYTIFRLPILLCNPKTDAPLYNAPLNSKVELITSADAAYAFARSINFSKELNRKTFNVAGGSQCRIVFRDYLIKILKIHGLSIRYLLLRLLADKNFYGGYYEDGSKIDDILQFRNGTISGYFKELESNTNKIVRFLPKLFALPFIFLLQFGKKKKK